MKLDAGRFPKAWGVLGTPLVMLGLLGSPARAEPLAPPPGHAIVPDQELLITDLAVVDSERTSYPGPWSFGYLMEQAFGKEQAPTVVRNWLDGWRHGTLRGNNGKHAEQRPGLYQELIGPWQRADGYQPHEGKWQPNFENAPFRLLAIVNRMDLARPLEAISQPPTRRSTYQGAANLALDASAGEARLVFAITDQQGRCLEPGTTFILEYGLDVIGSRDHIFDWVEAWHGLGAHQAFDEGYLDSLERVTRAFTDRRSTDPVVDRRQPEIRVNLHRQREKRRGSLPIPDRLSVGNGSVASQLMRVRTNDGSFGKSREFREFHIHPTGMLPAVLAGTPSDSHFQVGSKENQDLSEWLKGTGVFLKSPKQVRDRPESVIPSTFEVPRNLLALVSSVQGADASYHWDSPEVDRRLRHAFSRQTCCGCHCGDTGTEFFHIAPRASGEETQLSAFLRSGDAPHWFRDPAGLHDLSLNDMRIRRDTFHQLVSALEAR